MLRYGPFALEAARGRRYTPPPFYRQTHSSDCISAMISVVNVRLRYRRGSLWLAAALACACASGCVQRRMTIRSNPPGATVYIDNQEIGATPVSTDFVYYGTREFRLIKDGYETQTKMLHIPAPWYQYTPVDFFAENVIPYEIRDERNLDFALEPQRLPPTEELLGRADELRAANRGENVVTPAGAVRPIPGVEAIPPGRPDPRGSELRLPN